MHRARRCCHGEAYPAILPPRTGNAEGIAFLIEGAQKGYQGLQMIARFKPC